MRPSRRSDLTITRSLRKWLVNIHFRPRKGVGANYGRAKEVEQRQSAQKGGTKAGRKEGRKEETRRQTESRNVSIIIEWSLIKNIPRRSTNDGGKFARTIERHWVRPPRKINCSPPSYSIFFRAFPRPPSARSSVLNENSRPRVP